MRLPTNLFQITHKQRKQRTQKQTHPCVLLLFLLFLCFFITPHLFITTKHLPIHSSFLASLDLFSLSTSLCASPSPPLSPPLSPPPSPPLSPPPLSSASLLPAQHTAMAITRLKARGEYMSNDDQWKIAVKAEKKSTDKWKGTHAWMLTATPEELKQAEAKLRGSQHQHQRQPPTRAQRSRSPAPWDKDTSYAARARMQNQQRQQKPTTSSAAKASRPTSPRRTKTRTSSGSRPMSRAPRTGSTRPRSNTGGSTLGSSSAAPREPPVQARRCWGSTPSSRVSSAGARRSRPASGRDLQQLQQAQAPPTPPAAKTLHPSPNAKFSITRQDRALSPAHHNQHHPMSFFDSHIPLRTSDTIGWLHRKQQQQQQQQQQQHRSHSQASKRQYPKPWRTNANLSSRLSNPASPSPTTAPAPRIATRRPGLRTVEDVKSRSNAALALAMRADVPSMTVAEFEERYGQTKGQAGGFVATPYASVSMGISAPVSHHLADREQQVVRQRHKTMTGRDIAFSTQANNKSQRPASLSKRGARSSQQQQQQQQQRHPPLSSIQAIEMTTNIYKRHQSGFRPEQI